MAAYRRVLWLCMPVVVGLVGGGGSSPPGSWQRMLSPACWLPRVRDQLHPLHSITSMGTFTFFYNMVQVIAETIYPANHVTGAKNWVFSTSHLAGTRNKIKLQPCDNSETWTTVTNNYWKTKSNKTKDCNARNTITQG